MHGHDAPDRACGDKFFGAAEDWVVAPALLDRLKADAPPANRLDDGLCLGYCTTKRLVADNRLPCLDSTEDEISMAIRRRRDDHNIHGRMLDGLVNIGPLVYAVAPRGCDTTMRFTIPNTDERGPVDLPRRYGKVVGPVPMIQAEYG